PDGPRQIEEVAGLHRLRRVSFPQRAHGGLVPERRDRLPVQVGARAVRARRRGCGRRPRRCELDDPVGPDVSDAALAAPRIPNGDAADARRRSKAEMDARILRGEIAASRLNLPTESPSVRYDRGHNRAGPDPRELTGEPSA